MIQIENAILGYDQEPVIEHLNLSVRPGERLMILGPSGCGKSTILKALMGLKGQGIDLLSGSVCIDDYYGPGQAKTWQGPCSLADTGSDHRRWLREQVGIIFQHHQEALHPLQSIEAQWKLGAGQESMDTFLKALEGLGFANPRALLKLYPYELSGGMAQRVAIALALCKEPPLILADEPTSALDAVIQKDILQFMRQWCQERGTTLVMVTHSRGAASFLGTRIMDLGGDRVRT